MLKCFEDDGLCSATRDSDIFHENLMFKENTFICLKSTNVLNVHLKNCDVTVGIL